KQKTSMRIRELLARVKAFLDLYVMNTQPRFLGPQEPILAVEDPTEASNAEHNIPIE
ncbi:SanA protein, partial [Vibrio parahaemolyticus]|nr:SanA protein [Vibrio parahaemolyticus]